LFREGAKVLSENEPRVFSPYSWDREDREYESSDVLKKLDEDSQKCVEDSLKRVEAWQKRVEAAQERLDYFSQWFSDDFLQRFLDVLLQRPSDDFSQWLSDIAKWDNEAARKLWDGYYGRMVRLARRKLEGFGVSRGDYDEEDVASDAMLVFYRGMKKRQYPELHHRDNLWRLLFTITVRKANDRRKLCFTQKRSGLVQVHEESSSKKQLNYETIAALGLEVKDEDNPGGFAGIPDKKQLTPEDELIAAEKFLFVAETIRQLPNEELRLIATLMIDGRSTTEIAGTLKCTDQTVRNKRDKIRDSLLVKLMGIEPIPQRADEVVKKYQPRLNTLDANRRPIAESWLKGDKPQEIAKKLGRSSTTIYSELLRIARMWENN
jgi:RNA polymerase sigma factor (sigma-70 family)